MEQTFYYIVIGALIVEYLLSTISAILNVNSITEELPSQFIDVYDREKYARSQAYLKAKTRFGLLSSTCGLFVILVVIHLGLFGYLDGFVREQTSNPILAGLLFFAIIFIINDLITIPFSLYSTFVIEQKFEFNRTTPRTYLVDKLKGYLVTALLGGIVLGTILFFFDYYGPSGWWIAWLAISLFMVAIQPLFVHIIAPMFNKFTPLEKGGLRSAIEAYAEKVKFPLTRIDVMDGSRRSSHSNAYFSGFGKSKRVALFDTLLTKHNTEEIVSVVAHEVGHYKKKHIILGTILSVLETGVMLFVFRFIMSDSDLFLVFGVEQVSVYAGVIFFSLLYAPVNLITSLFTCALSRYNEYQADRYAFDTTGNKEALISMLKGLAANNLSHLTPHPMTVFLSYSHPPVTRRIEAITVLS